MKCFYHADMDGKCAAAIVYQYFMGGNFACNIECIPLNYKDDFPFEKVDNSETVYIVDFSLQKDGDMEKLMEITRRIVWIDHHKTAIEKHKKFEVLPGVRTNGVSGCELTWVHFYGTDVPEIVRMIGSYDVWDFKVYGKSLDLLQAGLKLQDTNPTSAFWKTLLAPGFEAQGNIAQIIENGKIALAYRNAYYKELVESWSFKVRWGDLRAICCNAGLVSSQLFDSITDDYDILITFIFDGGRYTVSLYSKDEKIDVSLIAKKYGGGGHAMAAGFQCDVLPFKKMDEGG